MYGYLKNDRIKNVYEMGWCLTILFGTHHTWYGVVASHIFLQHVHFGLFYVYFIVPHPTTNMANVSGIVGGFNPFVYMEGICGSLFLNDTFGHGNMTCWPKCTVCVLEARIR